MKAIPNLLLVFLLWLALILGCASSKKPTTTASTTDAYKTLPKSSTYADVVKAMGEPDTEAVSVPPDALLPNITMGYKNCRCIVFVYFTKTPKKKTNKAAYDKKFTSYMGVKGIDKDIVLHVSDENYRILLDSLKLK